MAELPEGFDLASLLAPIPGDRPTGADLREDYSPASVYLRLRDARAEARDAERQAEAAGGEDTGAPLQWRTVQNFAVKALAESAKDLEVAAWLIEALVRSAGLRGLTAGAAVVAGLAEGFWDDLYPLPDEDGVETRVAPITGLSGQGTDGTLMQPLRKVALFRRPDGSPFGYWQYELSVEMSGITDPARRQQRLNAGVLAFDDFEREARAAGAAHWSALRREVAGALAAWTVMGEVLDARAGADGPSTGRVRDLLLAMEAAARRFAPEEAAAPIAGAAPDAGPAVTAGLGGATSVAAPGAIRGREDALRRLGEIAAWFKQAEPHSPLSYTLEEAVRRGRMTWIELMAELMPDAPGRNAVLVSLGIKPPPEDEASS